MGMHIYLNLRKLKILFLIGTVVFIYLMLNVHGATGIDLNTYI
jgi:hypothetical protein